MEDFRKSLYAINKVSKNIVYKNADGSYLEVTFEKVAAENPNFTAEDFAKLKELSDELFHDEDRADWRYHHYAKENIDNYLNNKMLSSLGLEDEYLSAEDERQLKQKMREAIDTVLTPTQRRRFLMYYVKGMALKEIAFDEHCSLNAVSKSILDAQKEIVNFL